MSTKPAMTHAAQVMRDSITGYLVDFESSRDRAKQSAANIMGASNIGDCRERARHMVLKTPHDPDFVRRPKYDWAAMVGHAIEREVLDRLEAQGVQMKRGLEVTTTLPSGFQITGHPDALMTRNNVILDVKTVNGLSYVKRDGADLNQLFQRRLYAAGCIQAGLTEPDKPVYCGNVWFDRSAGDDEYCWVELEEYGDWMLDEIDQWLSDVTYAVANKEPAMRDRPYEFCRAVCPFFGSCRGDEDPPNELEDPQGKLDRAAEDITRAKALEREAKALRDQARQLLEGENGKTARFVVKSTHINETESIATYRPAHTRLTIKERK